jgi:hypothetical protein
VNKSYVVALAVVIGCILVVPTLIAPRLQARVDQTSPSGAWVIDNIVLKFGDANGDGPRLDSTHSVLLNVETGDTWLCEPTGSGMAWTKMKRD